MLHAAFELCLTGVHGFVRGQKCCTSGIVEHTKADLQEAEARALEEAAKLKQEVSELLERQQQRVADWEADAANEEKRMADLRKKLEVRGLTCSTAQPFKETCRA